MYQGELRERSGLQLAVVERQDSVVRFRASLFRAPFATKSQHQFCSGTEKRDPRRLSSLEPVSVSPAPVEEEPLSDSQSLRDSKEQVKTMASHQATKLRKSVTGQDRRTRYIAQEIASSLDD